MKRNLVIILSFLTVQLFGQDQAGIMHSNYASTNTVEINPANTVLSKSFINVNLAGFHAFANNNLVYIAKDQYKLGQFVKGNFENVTPSYNLSTNKSIGNSTGTISGPAIAMSFGDHGFDLHANLKVFGNVGNAPTSVADYAINNTLPVAGNYQYQNMKGAGLSYAEFGGSYSRNILKKGNQLLAAGATFNYLVGIGGGAAKLHNVDLDVLNAQDVQLNTLHGEYMYVNPEWKSGKGFSTSFGINYALMEGDVTDHKHNTKESDCNCEDHKLKLGASLIDLGFVNFKDKALYRNFSENGDPSSLTGTVENLDANIAAQTTDGAQQVWSRSKIYLPGAFSLQADYKVQDHLYIAGAYIHGFNKGRKRFGVERANVLSLTPRIEFKRFEFALPVSVWEWRKPQLGAMIRINNNLIIGTDKLGGLIGKTNVYGADIYVNLKFGITRNPSCKSKDKGSPSFSSSSPKPSKYKKKKSNNPKKKSGKHDTYSCPAWN